MSAPTMSFPFPPDNHDDSTAIDPTAPLSCDAVQTMLARVEVAKFVRRTAKATAAEVGFGWVAVSDAPSTYQQLRGAYAASQATGQPLPISSLNNDSSVFIKAEDNIAFRFWHDVSHVRLGLSFALADELELATWHLAQAERAGFAPGSLCYRLLEADHVGQVLMQALSGRFPFNQEAFVLTYARHGVGLGLLAELRRIPGINEGTTVLVTGSPDDHEANQ